MSLTLEAECSPVSGGAEPGGCDGMDPWDVDFEADSIPKTDEFKPVFPSSPACAGDRHSEEADDSDHIVTPAPANN